MAFKNRRKENIQTEIIVADNPTSIISEQVRTIRTNIQFSMVDQKLQTLLVTSATPASGKTTIATNLAAAFASENTQVLLVATDMRKPRLQKIFRTKNSRGISNLITNPSLRVEDVATKTYIENLSVITCGPIPPNPSELLNSNRMTKLIEEMKEQYDLVIFDSPPLLTVTDAQILSTKVDGTIFVIPASDVKVDEVQQASERLKNVNAKVLGTVLNKVEPNEDAYYYYESE